MSRTELVFVKNLRHSMNHKDHHEGSLVNIVSGKLAPGTANVKNAVVVEEAMLKDFENTWPEGFLSTT